MSGVRRGVHWTTAVVVLGALLVVAVWTVALVEYFGAADPVPPSPAVTPGLGQTTISGDLDDRKIVCVVWWERDGDVGADCRDVTP